MLSTEALWPLSKRLCLLKHILYASVLLCVQGPFMQLLVVCFVFVLVVCVFQGCLSFYFSVRL